MQTEQTSDTPPRIRQAEITSFEALPAQFCSREIRITSSRIFVQKLMSTEHK